MKKDLLSFCQRSGSLSLASIRSPLRVAILHMHIIERQVSYGVACFSSAAMCLHSRTPAATGMALRHDKSECRHQRNIDTTIGCLIWLMARDLLPPSADNETAAWYSLQAWLVVVAKAAAESNGELTF